MNIAIRKIHAMVFCVVTLNSDVLGCCFGGPCYLHLSPRRPQHESSSL